MTNNEAIAIVGCSICIAATLIFGIRREQDRPCTCSVGLIHDGLKPSDTPAFTNMMLRRIETGLPIVSQVETNTGPIVFMTNRLTLPDADVGARPGDVLVMGPITNISIPTDPVWIPVEGLRDKLTLSNPVVRAVIRMDRNKMIAVELEHVTTKTGLERWIGSTNNTMRRVQ